MIFTQLQNNFSYLILPVSKIFKTKEKEEPAEDLLSLLQQKSERGFTLLYDLYADALFSIIYQIIGKRATGEELLLDSFVKIWQEIDTYDESKGTLFTWLSKIARHKAIDFMRSLNNEYNNNLLEEDLQKGYFDSSNEIRNTNQWNYVGTINNTNALDDKYAVVLDLIYFEGCTYERVATLLKLPLAIVQKRGRTGLALLKKRI